MRSLEAIEPDPARLRRELDELEQYLSTGAPLKEREHVAPFFKKRAQLAAALGFACNEVQYVDRFAIELGLFGDFACDVASGDSDANAFTLVEFESAEPYTIFARAKPGSVRSWAPRFEHGFSQLVDWVWRLQSEGSGEPLRRIFGNNSPHLHLLLVIGRRADLKEDDYDRLRWRSRNVSVAGYTMSCWTFDDVLSTLRRRLAYMEENPTP
ncbi:MAG: Shedu anti-phage system protein SduA domain-containing protein [Microvirga sp.]